jgi:predicted dehydrogenase
MARATPNTFHKHGIEVNRTDNHHLMSLSFGLLKTLNSQPLPLLDMDHKLTALLIGAGNQGFVHLRSLAALEKRGELTIAAVCDPNEQALERVKSAFPHVEVYTDYKQAIQSTWPSFAILCLPNLAYTEALEYCFERGIHVMKEKPLALTISEAEKYLNLADRTNCLLFVAQQRFHHPHYLKAKNWLRHIGKVLYFNYNFTLNDKRYSWYWERDQGGGSWYGLGWHACSALYHFLGQPETMSVHWISSGKRSFTYDTDDTTVINCTYGDGTIATAFTSVVSPEKSEAIYIQGRSGSIQLTRSGVRLFNNEGEVLAEDKRMPSEEELYSAQVREMIQRCMARRDDNARSISIMKMIQTGIISARQKGRQTRVDPCGHAGGPMSIAL